MFFHEQVRNGYLKLQEMYPDRIVLIDGTQKPDIIFEIVLKTILEKINTI